MRYKFNGIRSNNTINESKIRRIVDVAVKRIMENYSDDDYAKEFMNWALDGDGKYTAIMQNIHGYYDAEYNGNLSDADWYFDEICRIYADEIGCEMSELNVPAIKKAIDEWGYYNYADTKANESVRGRRNRKRLNEAYGTDFDDTLAWVMKVRPDLSPAAQRRFATNIMNKYQRTHSSVPAQQTREPERPARQPQAEDVYQIWSNNNYVRRDFPADAIDPPFCYAHGRLEDDMRFDLFMIDHSFSKYVVNDFDLRPGKYKCVYEGKPCIFYVWYSKHLGGHTTGLVCYDDDVEALDYIKDTMDEDSY